MFISNKILNVIYHYRN